MLRLTVFSGLVILCFGETLVSGPYPPSGWKPKGVPFTLPKQFLPPQQQQQQRQATDVEVTQERVEYLGQIGETTTNIPEPNISYLPAEEEPEGVENEETSTNDYLKVQGLPAINNGPQFNTNEQKNNMQFQLNRGENVGQQKNLVNGQLRQQQKQQINQKAQSEFVNTANLPANQYGAPSNLVQDKESDNNDETDLNQKNVDANVESNTDDETTDDQTNVPGVENSVNSNGQYYILTPDNTLQRVIFMTSQNSEEARTNGFTAQLRYMPVEPIRDPIYSYNAQGQLIRIFKK